MELRQDRSEEPRDSRGSRDVSAAARGAGGATALFRTTGATVEGLSPEAAVLLADTAPPGVLPRSLGGGTFAVDAAGDALVAWIDRFITAAARRFAPASAQDPPPWCYGRNVGASECGDLPADRDRRAVHDLRYRQEGAPLGRWTFDLLSQRVGSFSGKNVFAARSAGIRVLDGLRWDDMTTVEVKNLSAGRTAADVGVKTTVTVLMAAAMVPVVAIGAGGRSIGNGVPSDPGISHAPALDGALPSGGAGAEPESAGITLWGSGLRLPSATGARPLLGGAGSPRG